MPDFRQLDLRRGEIFEDRKRRHRTVHRLLTKSFSSRVDANHRFFGRSSLGQPKSSFATPGNFL